MEAPSANGSTLSHITVNKLHPTFGAEISGVDFSAPVTDEVFKEILATISKVCWWTCLNFPTPLNIKLSVPLIAYTKED